MVSRARRVPRWSSNLEKPIRLEPLTKFPLVRDLQVDRGSMFENLKKTKCWIPIDGTYDIGPGRACRRRRRKWAIRFRNASVAGTAWKLPKVNENSHFVGAAIVSQVRLFNMPFRRGRCTRGRGWKR